MKLKLCLLTLKRYTGKDGQDRVKGIFVSENDKVYQGFMLADQLTPEIEQLVIDTNTFDKDRARTWEVEQDVWNEKLTYKVLMDSVEL